MMKQATIDNTRQSELIKAMRFPLIVLVVVAHSVGAWSGDFIHADWSDGWTWYHYVSELICHNLCPIGTCWFFVISGYFFFFNLRPEEFSWNWVLGKWKKRLRTLLLPYLIWNLLYVLLAFLKIRITGWLGGEISPNDTQILSSGPLYWFVTGPVDFPLWFMRDLMIMSLIAPVLYWIFHKFPWAGLAALFVLYMPVCTFVSPYIRSIFFFGLGVWLGTGKVGLLSVCRAVRVPSFILTGVLVFVVTYLMGTPLHEWARRLFWLVAMIAFMNFCDILTTKDKTRERFSRLASAVFFIYAAHEVYILGLTKGVFVRALGEGLAATWIKFIFVPVLVLIICLLLYRVIDYLFPRALAFACGGRTRGEQQKKK